MYLDGVSKLASWEIPELNGGCTVIFQQTVFDSWRKISNYPLVIEHSYGKSPF
jgi:hypothetical protein